VTLGSFLLTGLVRRYALERLIDLPNARSSHQRPTPRGGGLALLLGFLAGCVLLTVLGRISADLLGLLLTGLPVGAVGFWDDHGHVPARLRLAVHITSAGAALMLLGGFSLMPLGVWSADLGWFGSVFALLWLVWLLNLFNFMDGTDAIAGTEVIFVACAAALLMFWRDGQVDDVAVSLILLAAATLGFQFWNWPPAKIFLGDVGSGFVGYTLALLALSDMHRSGGGLGLPVWVILNGIFLVDATYTLLRRMAGGQTWHQPHRLHAYQKAAALFGEHGRVVKFCAMLNLCWLLPWAVAASVWQQLAFPIAVIAVLPLLGVAIRLRAGRI
jgi:Fuc2NAc and GlcNAc transferase